MSEETTDTQATAEAESVAAEEATTKPEVEETAVAGPEETVEAAEEEAAAEEERDAEEEAAVAEKADTEAAGAETDETPVAGPEATVEEAAEETAPEAEEETDAEEEAAVAEKTDPEPPEAEVADTVVAEPEATVEEAEEEAAPEAEEETDAEEAAAVAEKADTPAAGPEAMVEEEAAPEAEEEAGAEPEAAAETTEEVAAEQAPSEEDSQIASPASISDLEKKMRVKGTVERLELYGAFINIGVDTPALIHISKLEKGRVNRVSDVLSVGDEVEVWIEKVDPEQNQIMVSMLEPLAVEWTDLKERQVYTGTVTRLENYGAFVDIGAEREGLVHISEMSHDYVKHPSEVVSVDDQIEVQVLGFNRRKRRIDLSMKALLDSPEREEVATAEDFAAVEADNEEMPTAMEIAMRRAMQKEGREGSESKKDRKQRKQKGQEDILSRTLKLRE